MDLSNITLAGLIALGVVNVLTMYKPDMDSKLKFSASLIVALAVSFIPVELGNVLLDHLKTSLEVAFAASGAYKVAQKVGGN